MFEQASKLKLRFPTTAGKLTVEDLWDLPLTSTTNRPNLDDMARGYSRELASQEQESFVVELPTKNRLFQLPFDIIKHVIEVKLIEKQAAQDKAAKTIRRNKLLDAIVAKEDQVLSESSIEDLRKELDSL